MEFLNGFNLYKDFNSILNSPDLATSEEFKVFPSIIQRYGRLTIEAPEGRQISITLYNEFGQLINHTEELQGGTSNINAPGKSGLFYIKLLDAQSQKYTVKKLIVE